MVNPNPRAAIRMNISVRFFATLKDRVGASQLEIEVPENLSVGDKHFLPQVNFLQTKQDIADRYGDVFAEHVSTLELNNWQGPIPSTQGVHFVRVVDHRPAALPPLDEVRSRVFRLWQAEQQNIAIEQYVMTLRERYTVQFDSGELLRAIDFPVRRQGVSGT